MAAALTIIFLFSLDFLFFIKKILLEFINLNFYKCDNLLPGSLEENDILEYLKILFFVCSFWFVPI